MREQFGGAILLDDPHKASEARSKKRRENVHNWFAETLNMKKTSKVLGGAIDLAFAILR